MKRFHVHVAVADLEQSIRFYSAMFASEPSVTRPDYAKWMLDDPRLNFAISTRGGARGINHLGFQAESDDELESIHANLRNAGSAVVEEKGVSCCYARSDKYWVTDPSGIAWESFRSLGSVPHYSGDPAAGRESANASCGTSTTGCCAGDATQVSAGSGCCASAAA